MTTNPDKPLTTDASIISLATGEPVTVVKRQDTYCMSHCHNILVDAHQRQLTCRECGAIVDPFNWALRMAMEESQLQNRIFHLKNESNIHAKRVDDLKAEEQRIKSRTRAAKDSLLRSAGV